MSTERTDAGHDLEQALGAWLQREGPQDVPDRVVEAAISRAAATSRLRPWPAGVVRLIDHVSTRSRGESVALDRRRAWAGWSVAWVVALTVLLGAFVAVGSLLTAPPPVITNGPIAFDSDGDIFIVDPSASSRPRGLTATADVTEQGPVWSPDGGRLAFRVTTGAETTIQITNADGNPERILTAPPGLVLPPDDPIVGWSPDGRFLAAPARGSSNEGGVTRVGVAQVVVYDVETGHGEALAPDLEASGFGWSPDGRWIGLVGADGQLYVVSPQDGRPIALSASPGSSDERDRLRSSFGVPSFAGPDQVAFTADLADVAADQATSARRDGDILVAALDDRVKAVVEGPNNDVAPHLSPDGQLLAFGRSVAVTAEGAFSGPWGGDPQAAGADLYLVGYADGRAALPDPDLITSDVWPDAVWSPDGRLLVTKSSDWTELVVVTLGDHTREQRIRVAAPDTLIGNFSWRPLPP